ncbi:reverse transcriptase domain-containing protein [Tanacetum coccineum]
MSTITSEHNFPSTAFTGVGAGDDFSYQEVNFHPIFQLQQHRKRFRGGSARDSLWQQLEFFLKPNPAAPIEEIWEKLSFTTYTLGRFGNFNRRSDLVDISDGGYMRSSLYMYKETACVERARIWLEKEPPRSIQTWDDLVFKIHQQNFPPSKTTNLRNEITRFQQRFDETFYEAWDRFNDLLRACPHHGFSELHQLDTFYNALNSNDQDSLNSAAGGNFLDKMPRDCLRIIESKSKVLKDMVKALLLDKKNQSPAPTPVKAVEESCVTCGAIYRTEVCTKVCAGFIYPNKVVSEPGYDKQCRRRPRVGQELLQQLMRTDTGADGMTEGKKQNRFKLKSSSKGREVNIAAEDSDDALVCCVENTLRVVLWILVHRSMLPMQRELKVSRLHTVSWKLLKDVRYSSSLKRWFNLSWSKLIRKLPHRLRRNSMKVTKASKGNIPDAGKVDIYFCKPGGLRKQKKLSFIMSVKTRKLQRLEQVHKEGYGPTFIASI